MKWSIAGLILLGLGAAASATVLVAALRADAAVRVPGAVAAPEPAPDVNIVLAQRDLPAMSVVEASAVVARSVPRLEAPDEYFSNPAQVIGKVLALPVLAGQVFTPESLVAKGSGPQLAAAIRDGMRAVTVCLSRDACNQGVLYPGSVVDVLVALELPKQQSGEPEEALSSTLLQGVEVLAIEDHTVVSGEPKTPRSAGDRKQNVTLLVDAKQALLLQLAREHGSISLSLRNPLDGAPVASPAVLLTELAPEFFGRSTRAPATTPAPADGETPRAGTPIPRWEIEIIRGGTVEKRTVEPPAAGGGVS
jgi:pilus assembly protein CpaB